MNANKIYVRIAALLVLLSLLLFEGGVLFYGWKKEDFKYAWKLLKTGEE